MSSHFTAWFGACLIILHANNLPAQQPDKISTVGGRFASVLQPEGVPVGAMRLYPRFGAGALYSDNVFANDEFEESDWAVLMLAEAVLQSDTSRYFIELGARADLARFSDFDINDYDNGRVWFATQKDLTSASDVDFDLGYARLTEPRTSANIARGSLELTPYGVTSVSGQYRFQPSRWALRVDGRYRYLDFDDVLTLTGPVNSDDRDRKGLDFGTRIGYDLADAYGLFLEARLSSLEYDQRIDNQGFARSFDGNEIRLGAELRLAGLVVGEFFLGYLTREFDDPRFAKAQGPSYGAAIDWVITELTTLTIGGSRTTDPTTVAGASTILNSRVLLGVDHELRRNLILQLGIEVANEDFQDIEREDDNVIIKLGTEYRMNRNFWLVAGYRHWDRDSGPPGSGGRRFTINEVTIEVTYQI